MNTKLFYWWMLFAIPVILFSFPAIYWDKYWNWVIIGYMMMLLIAIIFAKDERKEQ